MSGLYKMHNLYVLPILYVLAGCATPPTPEPIIVTQEVRVPVAVACVDASEIPPVRPYADQRIQPPADIVQMLDAMMEGISERDDDLPVLRALLAGCVID